jgi:CheY-like chemotaxis protein
VQVKERNEFEAVLQQNKFDLIVSDFSLPMYNGATALAAAKQIQPDKRAWQRGVTTVD